jgi:hypothetical protein
MEALEFFNTISKYAVAVPHPKFDLLYFVKYRMDIVLGRKVYKRFRSKYPSQTLRFHVTKKNKVILGGEFRKDIIDITGMSDIIKLAKKDS